MRHFFEGLQNYMENKSEANESKITLDKTILWIKWAEVVEMKHKNFVVVSNYALSKLIVKNRLEENPDSTFSWQTSFKN